MFSLQKLLGKETLFFNLLEGSSEEAHTSAKALKKLLADPSSAGSLSELRQARQKNKSITEEISEKVVQSFVTVLEREDIEALSVALYKIPKPIEKFAERFLIVSAHVSAEQFTQQALMLETATETVVAMVKELRKGNNLEAIKKLNSKLQQLEAEADLLEVDLLKSLYSSKQDPIRVIVLKDLYDLLEKVVDRCRDAGNVVTHIFFKNS